jgi:hypothetical protein
MIIIFLKCYSVCKAQEAAHQKKEAPAKETTERVLLKKPPRRLRYLLSGDHCQRVSRLMTIQASF